MSNKKKGCVKTPSEKALALEAFISEKGDGDEVSYEEVLRLLRIDMRTPDGRSMFYDACHRLHREYLCKPKFGYIMSKDRTAPAIMGKRIKTIIESATRGERTANNLIERHEDTMTEPEKSVVSLGKIGCKAIAGKARSEMKQVRKHIMITEAVPVV